MRLKYHHIYGLRVDGEIYYVGYSRNHPAHRMAQHIAEAVEPSSECLYQRLIHGGPTAKHTVILNAIANNQKLDYVILASAPRSETLDEQWYIEHYRNLGYKLTNVATGNSNWDNSYKDRYSKPTQSNYIAPEPEDLEFKKMMRLHSLKDILKS